MHQHCLLLLLLSDELIGDVEAASLILAVLDIVWCSVDLPEVTDIGTDGIHMGWARLASWYPISAAHHPRVPMHALLITQSASSDVHHLLLIVG